MKRTARLAVATTLAIAGTALAQPYPSKPVRVVVPFPPGQATEIVGRLVAQRMSESLGRNFTVDNRPGAGGIIGVEAVAKAPPDGYTLLITASGTLVINPNLYRSLSYDPLRDFAPISLLGIFPLVAVAHPSLPARTVKELVALAKARPGQINFASSGPGTAQHLAGELFRFRTGADIVHVPYKGSGPAVSDLIGGHVTLMFDTVTSSLPHIQGARLKALAVTSAHRSSALPQVPTMGESGVKDLVAVGWAAALAPAGTPRDIVTRLNAEIVRILGNPEMKERVLALGCEPATGTPEDLARFIKGELARWAEAVTAARVKLD
jgi:tripartite-type tricarboxylate transporter receptor subunit TctC